MPTEIKVPELGDGVKSVDISAVLVSVGNTISVGQSILEVETDKATVEIPSEVAGTVVSIAVKKRDKIKPGQVILVLDAKAGAAPTVAAAAPAPTAAASTPAPVTAAPAPQTVAAAPAPAPAAVAAPADESASDVSNGQSGLPIPAAPSVRKFARETGVDLQWVKGSGPGGRISVDDVKDYLRNNKGGGDGSPASPLVTIEPMSKLRKVAAERLTQAWSAPHVTLHSEVDVTELEEVRQNFKKRAEAAGGKLTITAMFIKIVSAALKVYPRVNSAIHLDRGEIELKKYYNVGVAVDTPRGLVVPVLREVDKKNIMQIGIELNEMSKKARDGKLTPDDMSNGTFTVTNLGGLGIGHFSPIVNVPQVAILGMGKSEMAPVWNGTAFEPKLMMPLSLSFDHRVIDGADGARFLNWLVDAVENPLLLSLEG